MQFLKGQYVYVAGTKNPRTVTFVDFQFSPSIGPTKGGTSIMIKGENFGSNHKEASVSVWIGKEQCVPSSRNMSL